MAASSAVASTANSKGGDEWPLFSRKDVRSAAQMGRALLIIDNVVYDVGVFLRKHPGGRSVSQFLPSSCISSPLGILPMTVYMQIMEGLIGRDASLGFASTRHSSDAIQKREELKAGELLPEDVIHV